MADKEENDGSPPVLPITMKQAYSTAYHNGTISPGGDIYLTIETAGYREITTVLSKSSVSDAEFLWFVDGTGIHDSFFTEEIIQFLDFDGGKAWRTYGVLGAKIRLRISSYALPCEWHLSYYMSA